MYKHTESQFVSSNILSWIDKFKTKDGGKKQQSVLSKITKEHKPISFILYTFYRQLYGDFFTSAFD